MAGSLRPAAFISAQKLCIGSKYSSDAIQTLSHCFRHAWNYQLVILLTDEARVTFLFELLGKFGGGPAGAAASWSFANPCVLAAGDSRRIVKIGGRLLGGMLFGVGGAGDGAGALSQDGQKGQGAVRMIESAGDGAGAWGSHCKTMLFRLHSGCCCGRCVECWSRRRRRGVDCLATQSGRWSWCCGNLPCCLRHKISADMLRRHQILQVTVQKRCDRHETVPDPAKELHLPRNMYLTLPAKQAIMIPNTPARHRDQVTFEHPKTPKHADGCNHRRAHLLARAYSSRVICLRKLAFN